MCNVFLSGDVGISEDEEEDCFITFTTSESRCDALFDRGLDMVAQGDPSAALKTFLETLTALQECQYTNKLLPTLYQLTEVYSVLGEADKCKEISDTLSSMHEALNNAVRERKKGKRERGRGRTEQVDCMNLFLCKANALECFARESEEKGDITCALKFAESAFRIQQYTLGPQHPVAVQSQANLSASCARCGGELRLSNDAEPIIFTSVIIESSSQQSTTKHTSVTSSHSNAQSPCSAVRGSIENHFSPAGALSEETLTCVPGCSTDSTEGDNTTATQDVVSCSKTVCIDKPHLECHTDKDKFHVSCDPFPPPSTDESTDLTSLFTFLVIFSVTAFAAFSFF